MRSFLCALALAASLPSLSYAACPGPGRATAEEPSTLEEIVERIHAEGVKYVFVGEQHGAGPVKRFAVDLVNALVDAGDDVGLYVEGFRTDCARPGDAACDDLARLFNPPAFLTLLTESRAAVHAIDPVERDRRAARMAATISRGAEKIRVVLAGGVHVLHARDAAAEVRVYGGGMRYPDPGDLVEAFARHDYLTVGLETVDVADAPYRLSRGGCASDYVLAAPDTRDYWSHTLTAESGAHQPPAGR
jgi:hypothetical protein